LRQAGELVADVLGADKVDIFLCDETETVLQAIAGSNTPLGRRQQELGLDRRDIMTGGRTAQVFRTGVPHHHNRLDEDAEERSDVACDLGIRSTIAMPLDVAGRRRGVVQADCYQEERFSPDDLRFFAAVANWVGIMIQRAESAQARERAAAEEARRQMASELITILAHDLNNLLTPILARLDLMRARAGREERSWDAEEIVQTMHSVTRMQRIISDLLDLGRLERGIFSLRVLPVDLAAIVRRSAEVLSRPANPIEVRAPATLTARVDPDRLEQALSNLLANACRYSPEDMPVILSLDTEEHNDGPWAIFSVQDFGPGLSPDLLSRLCAPFTTGPGSKGLGLGLYLTRSIVEAHGGTLSVESTPYEGATFRIAIPIRLHEGLRSA
jgi:signal transduction histidine kinase